MNQRHEHRIENNTNHVTGSTVQGPLIAGSGATVTIHHSGTTEEREALAAVAHLRTELAGALAALDRRDDQTKESLLLVGTRLDGLEEELKAGADERDPERVKKLLSGIKETVVGLAGILSGVDGLWAAVQSVLR